MSREIFCYAPWTSLYLDPNGEIRPCCVSEETLSTVAGPESLLNAYQSSKLKEIRATILAGEKPKSCISCIKKDSLGVSSRRLFYPPRTEVSLSVEGDRSLVDYLDISFSNVCNLRCRFCGPFCSSKWIEDAERLPNTPSWEGHKEKKWRIQSVAAEDLLLELENFPRLKRMDINGGEPFLSKQHLRFLQILAENGRSREISLIYTTNGTINPEEFLEPLKKFKSVTITISSEGVGDIYRYSRGFHGAEEQLEKTIEFFHQIPNIQISMRYTLFALNIFGIEGFWKWYESIQNRWQISLQLGTVVAPQELQVRNLPLWFRKLAAERIPQVDNEVLHKIRDILLKEEDDFQNQTDANAKLKHFWDYVNTLDQIQKTSLIQSQPIYKQIERGF